MKLIDYAKLLKDYLSNNVLKAELDSANRSYFKNTKLIRGASSRVPDASIMNGTKISHKDILKIKNDIISEVLPVHICLLWIDMITMNSEKFHFEEGCLDLLESINSTEDIKAWISEA